jgi:ATP-binding cassette subfamily B protein
MRISSTENDKTAHKREVSEKKGSMTNAQVLKRIALALKPYTMRAILLLVAIIISTLLGLVNPLLTQHLFDDAILKRNNHLLFIYITIMLINPIVIAGISVGQSYLNGTIGQNVMRDLRNMLYKHLQDMSLRFFTSTRAGEIQARLASDISGVQNTLTLTTASAISDITLVISTMVAMFLLSPLLTIISVASLPFFLWLTNKVGNTRRQTSKETQQSMATLTAVIQETLSVSGILLIKTFGRQKHTQKQFEQENQQLTRLGIRQQLIGRWFFMVTNTFFSILPVIIYLVAGLQYSNHEPITFGTIVAFTALQNRFFAPVGQLLNVQVELQGALALFERIFEYLDLPIEIQEKPHALQLRPEEVHGALAFKNVVFTYQEDMQKQKNSLSNQSKRSYGVERDIAQLDTLPTKEGVIAPALNHVSFEVRPGQLVALVGPSGAGKTTITSLVPRLYDVDEGAVEIDGHDVRDIALESLGNMIGIVTQETYLLHTSIRENLLYARLDATEEEMITAAKMAAIHDRIMELKEGYDTIVGERGYKLSGGEKQRLAIARVILKNPRILILDEATSALDTHSERLIQTALEPLLKGRTTLAIAHRLSTILAADLILVVEKGQIVERGTHQELLKRGGLYTQLYNEQFSPTQQPDREPLARSHLAAPLRPNTDVDRQRVVVAEPQILEEHDWLTRVAATMTLGERKPPVLVRFPPQKQSTKVSLRRVTLINPDNKHPE